MHTKAFEVLKSFVWLVTVGLLTGCTHSMTNSVWIGKVQRPGRRQAYTGVVSIDRELRASAAGDALRPGQKSWWTFAYSFWALAGAAGSAYLFVVSTGPVRATSDYGIWFNLAPPDRSRVDRTGPYGPSLYPYARLCLFSWGLALIVFPVAGVRLSKIQRPDWWPLAWASAAATGLILALIAITSYRFPPMVDDSSAMGYHYVPVTVINWQEIPVPIGFMVLAALMWLILTAHGLASSTSSAMISAIDSVRLV